MYCFVLLRPFHKFVCERRFRRPRILYCLGPIDRGNDNPNLVATFLRLIAEVWIRQYHIDARCVAPLPSAVINSSELNIFFYTTPLIAFHLSTTFLSSTIC